MSYRPRALPQERTLTTFPQFVREKILTTLNEHNEEEELFTEDTAEFTYYEIKATTDPFNDTRDVGKYLMIWVGSVEGTLEVYLGGSSAWVSLGDHYVSFDGIDYELTKDQPQDIWWVLEGSLNVFQVQIVPEADVPVAVPDIPMN